MKTKIQNDGRRASRDDAEAKTRIRVPLHKLKATPPIRYDGIFPVFECSIDLRFPESMCFKCPKCGKINCHGTQNGHRSSGCWNCWPDGYIVELTQ